MLIHASRRSGIASALAGDAHIVVSLHVASGVAMLRSFAHGEFDSEYAALPLAALPAEVGKLLEELQAQLLERS